MSIRIYVIEQSVSLANSSDITMYNLVQSYYFYQSFGFRMISLELSTYFYDYLHDFFDMTINGLWKLVSSVVHGRRWDELDCQTFLGFFLKCSMRVNKFKKFRLLFAFNSVEQNFFLSLFCLCLFCLVHFGIQFPFVYQYWWILIQDIRHRLSWRNEFVWGWLRW